MKQSETPQEGLIRRQMFAWCAHDLEVGRAESTFYLNGRKLTVREMEAFMAYARRYGFLK